MNNPGVLLCLTAAATLPAQTFSVLANFNVADGANTAATLVQATDGKFYGTAPFGGAGVCPWSTGQKGCGTIFTVTQGGMLSRFYSFLPNVSVSPEAGLVQARSGEFYGVTLYTTFVTGSSYGTIFGITNRGALTTLHTFNMANGANPNAALVQSGGDFLGTTGSGGANNYGTVFKITRSGSFTTLYNFSGPDGEHPNGLVQATDGSFYGTTYQGGAYGNGTVFQITPQGVLTTLHSFAYTAGGTEGDGPQAALVQSTDGNFYGTTSLGGTTDSGTIFSITPGGSFTTLYDFCVGTSPNCTDGAQPLAALIEATDGNLYGTTYEGGVYTNHGAHVLGTVFKITPPGKLTTLHSFDFTDGENPLGALLQATDGNFYGTTSGGGGYKAGTVFRVSVNLAPFVKTIPDSGEVGSAVNILGTNMGGATSVTFGGAAAAFTVVSQSLIKTTVPMKATTGKVQVTTPGGTLSSNVVFRVRP